jgi:ubiquitin carboxyl-terminal hydrolase 34
VEILSDDEEEEEILQLPEENKPTALEKMIALIALLVEKSRGPDKMLHLSDCDMAAIMGTKVGSHTATQLYGVYSTE